MVRGIWSPATRVLARGRLSVLVYHRVLPEPDPLRPGEADLPRFRVHMQTLARHFRVLPLSEALDDLASGRLPPAAAAVTFDDGYADNLTNAAPVLARLGLPATIFVASGFLDGGRMWNDTVIEAVRSAPGPVWDLEDLGLGRPALGDWGQRRRTAVDLLSLLKYRDPGERDEIVAELGRRCGAGLPGGLMLDSAGVRELAAQGMEVGSHTITHPILSRCHPAMVRQEIAEGREALEALVRRPVTLFAYPNGRPGWDYGPEHVAAVRNAGFRGAVSTGPGAARPGSDPFQIPRFTPWDQTPGRFAARLLLNARHRPALVGTSKGSRSGNRERPGP